MTEDMAACGEISPLLLKMGKHLDQYLRFEHPDALENAPLWKSALDTGLPKTGIGIEQLIEDMGQYILPHGSQIPKPGCTSWINTGATSIGVLATLAGNVASPQRFGLTAFNYLEGMSLRWMAEMFGLHEDMKGLYSSGGSVANLVALGAARQSAFEKIGCDPTRDGVTRACRIYVSDASHHTIHRATAVLGLGRSSVITIKTDGAGRMCVSTLKKQLKVDIKKGLLPVAIVATAGTTSRGAIDPLAAIGQIANEHNIWFHVDGAYGLPGILDPQVRDLYEGLSYADSVIIDPHKWLGAPIGIGATYVKDYGILQRAFSQGASDYIDGSLEEDNIQSSMDSMGVPYSDFGVELSSPSRGAVVWALIREIGVDGMRKRICRHNAMARQLATKVTENPNLELLQQPTLSICCFRYIGKENNNLNDLNRRIHRRLIHNGRNMPSTAMIGDKLAIRPCFIGARTNSQQVDDLLEEVLKIGDQYELELNQKRDVA